MIRSLLMFALCLAPVVASASSPLLMGKRQPCGVGANYQEPAGVAVEDGLAADGHPVAPADIDGGNADPSYNIYLGLPLSEYTTSGRGADLSQSLIDVGSIKVEGKDAEVNILGQHHDSTQPPLDANGCPPQ